MKMSTSIVILAFIFYQFLFALSLKLHQTLPQVCGETKSDKQNNFCQYYNETNRTYFINETLRLTKMDQFFLNSDFGSLFLKTYFDEDHLALKNISFNTIKECTDQLRYNYNQSDYYFCSNLVANKRQFDNFPQLRTSFDVYSGRRKMFNRLHPNDAMFDVPMAEIVNMNISLPQNVSACQEFLYPIYFIFLSTLNRNNTLDFCQFAIRYRNYSSVGEIVNGIYNFYVLPKNIPLIFFDYPTRRLINETISFENESQCQEVVTWNVVSEDLKNFCKIAVLTKKSFIIGYLHKNIDNYVANLRAYGKSLDSNQMWDWDLKMISRIRNMTYTNISTCQIELDFIFLRYFKDSYDGETIIRPFCKNIIDYRREYLDIFELREKVLNYEKNLILKRKNGENDLSSDLTFSTYSTDINNKFFDFSQEEMEFTINGLNMINPANTTNCGFEDVTPDTLLNNLNNILTSLNPKGARKSSFSTETQQSNSTLSENTKTFYVYLNYNIETIRKKIESRIKSNTLNLIPVKTQCSGQTIGKYKLEITHDLLPPSLRFNLSELLNPKVYDQGSCGSCWVFSTAAMMEARDAINNKRNSVEISRQQILDCVSAGSCSGGNPIYVMQYFLDNPLLLNEDYGAYTQKKGECRSIKTDNYKIKSTAKRFIVHKKVTAAQLKLLLIKGPIAVNLDAKKFAFVFYKSGVLKYFCDKPNHSVLLVGYSNDIGSPYWVIRNSWGNWGDNGYAKIRMEEDWDACGMYSDVIELIE